MQWVPSEKKEQPEAGDYIEVTARWGKHFVEMLDPIKGNNYIVRFYFDPPQREWVGLDDEDMKELRDADFDLLYGARWAERKLREKNGC